MVVGRAEVVGALVTVELVTGWLVDVRAVIGLDEVVDGLTVVVEGLAVEGFTVVVVRLTVVLVRLAVLVDGLTVVVAGLAVVVDSLTVVVVALVVGHKIVGPEHSAAVHVLANGPLFSQHAALSHTTTCTSSNH